MTVIYDDPSLWPIIELDLFFSYWMVAAGVVVVYDWVLSLGQEIELIWATLVSHYYAVSRYTLYCDTILCCVSSAIYAISLSARCRVSEIQTSELGSI
ncbi:hypothetical protein CY34DRAFT_808132 [Suillus luteus UH-Slu-Lm8-n1]|uniref:DUF6533 domain-containing protein n=1 Tax=Suillus luteus UH-Slu-Lm8-n1 TaxID=930992 RepID=A0A0D0AZ53_9AGAM|nr:hypothetical protein CY34DRAFT_808132 [Suillus luteus UH-Slu-Lm8-n1]